MKGEGEDKSMEGRKRKQQQRDKGSAGADGPTERKHEATGTVLILHQ